MCCPIEKEGRAVSVDTYRCTLCGAERLVYWDEDQRPCRLCNSTLKRVVKY
jgi:hypothetical protein